MSRVYIYSVRTNFSISLVLLSTTPMSNIRSTENSFYLSFMTGRRRIDELINVLDVTLAFLFDLHPLDPCNLPREKSKFISSEHWTTEIHKYLFDYSFFFD